MSVVHAFKQTCVSVVHVYNTFVSQWYTLESLRYKTCQSVNSVSSVNAGRGQLPRSRHFRGSRCSCAGFLVPGSAFTASNTNPVFGFRVPRSGSGFPGTRTPGFPEPGNPKTRNLGIPVFGFRVPRSSSASRVSGLGFRVLDLGFRVWDLGFRVSGFGFWVSGSGCRVHQLEGDVLRHQLTDGDGERHVWNDAPLRLHHLRV